jgi:hypothetical protein
MACNCEFGIEIAFFHQAVKKEEIPKMKMKLAVFVLLAFLCFPGLIQAQSSPMIGRWEIVHLTGDTSAQEGFPGSFSVYLNADGTGYNYGAVTSSACALDPERNTIVPTWVALGGNQFQITIAVNNSGEGPNFSFVYSGTFNASTPIPGAPSVQIPAITGTYYSVGDVSACNQTSQTAPGNFVATFVPTISSGTAGGGLDGDDALDGGAFDSSVNATLTFTTPPVPGQIAGTVSLLPNPTYGGKSCFATTGETVNPLTIDPDISYQSGVQEYMFAEGLDPFGAPTTLVLEGSSVNLYTAASETSPLAAQVTSNEWAVFAAIGEDNPAVGTSGVKDDGTNDNIVVLYGVMGGVCDGAGGLDSPFHFVSGKQIKRKPRHVRPPRAHHKK